MTLNPTDFRKCNVCCAKLSQNSKVGIGNEPDVSSGGVYQSDHAEKLGPQKNDGISEDYTRTYVRFTECMPLSSLGDEECPYRGSQLPQSSGVTMFFSPGSVGKLASGYSSKKLGGEENMC